MRVASAAPWTEAANAALSTKMEDPFARLADGSSWQPRQSSLAGGLGGGAAPLGGGGRGRRPEGGGREQKRGENAPEPHPSILLGRGIAGVRPLLDLVEVRDAVLVAVELLDLGEVVLAVLLRRREILAVGVDVRLALLGHRLHVAGAALRLGGVGRGRADLLLNVQGAEGGAGDERDGRGERDDSEAYLVHVSHPFFSIFLCDPFRGAT